ncbi:MAG: hypothetical protein M1839_005742 [Geoglossum umbratile]|nr:MAG: hypothetical protein M1839_005742 [Geoglossum umbratile]
MAESIVSTQVAQQENQLRDREAFQRDFDGAREILSQVVASVGLLQSAVDETSAKVKEMGVFSGLGSIIVGWGWLIVILGGVATVSRKAAGYMAIITGCGIAVASSGFLEQLAIFYPRLSPTDLTLYLRARPFWLILGLQLSGFCMIAVAVFAATRFLIGPRHLKGQGTLPTTEGSGDFPDAWQRFVTANKGTAT